MLLAMVFPFGFLRILGQSTVKSLSVYEFHDLMK